MSHPSHTRLFGLSLFLYRCEVGDLAGKFGPIPESGMLTETDTTGFLALSGRYSIVGRSLVIHRHDDNSNFECGTIRYVDEEPGTFMLFIVFCGIWTII